MEPAGGAEGTAPDRDVNPGRRARARGHRDRAPGRRPVARRPRGGADARPGPDRRARSRSRPHRVGLESWKGEEPALGHTRLGGAYRQRRRPSRWIPTEPPPKRYSPHWSLSRRYERGTLAGGSRASARSVARPRSRRHVASWGPPIHGWRRPRHGTGASSPARGLHAERRRSQPCGGAPTKAWVASSTSSPATRAPPRGSRQLVRTVERTFADSADTYPALLTALRPAVTDALRRARPADATPLRRSRSRRCASQPRFRAQRAPRGGVLRGRRADRVQGVDPHDDESGDRLLDRERPEILAEGPPWSPGRRIRLRDDRADQHPQADSYSREAYGLRGKTTVLRFADAGGRRGTTARPATTSTSSTSEGCARALWGRGASGGGADRH